MAGPVDYAFLHGGGQGSWVWRETIEALRRQTDGGFGRALLLDVPGCGVKRQRETAGLGFEEIAAELVKDIDEAGQREVVLVGHSQAGSLIPHMVAARPALFRRIIYLACSIPRPGQSVAAMVGSGVHGATPDEVGWPLDPKSHTIRERNLAMFCTDMTPEAAEAFLGRLGQDAWPVVTYTHTDWHYDQLASVPSSYIVCLRDGILPIAWQEVFAARFKAERIVRIDAGHQAMNTRPHALAEILRVEAR
jgi:pimeloyl-ACP methyl ester carboxylesterase